MNVFIALIGRWSRFKVHMVAVDVHVVFIDTAQPRKTIGIQGVNHHHRCISRQTCRIKFLQPRRLTATAIQTFHAMRGRDCDQHFAGIARTEPSHINGHVLALKSFLGMQTNFHLCARQMRRFQKRLACFYVICRKSMRHALLRLNAACGHLVQLALRL